MSMHELELAQRVSDRILCVNGNCVERFGTPEEIFQTGYIKALFDISTGSFDEENTSMELEAIRGKAAVFALNGPVLILAGAGSGRNTYRRLQQERTPFITGILYDNDLDYPVARALASEVITARAFEPVEQAAILRAKKAMDSCSHILCCRQAFGSLEIANKELLDYARQQGKQITLTSTQD